MAMNSGESSWRGTLFLRFGLGRWGQQAVRPKIHGSHPIMVGPTAGESQSSPRASARLAVEPLDVPAQLRVISVRQRCTAKLEGRFDGADQFVLGFIAFQFLHLGLGH